jgi:glycosyltransferase involved in cell wall biosynthesis
MQLEQITPLILTYNESVNIDRTLQKLQWAKEIIVIDSFSTDRTIDILKTYPQVKLLQRKFDNHTNQWNYGLKQIKTEWVLSLDADYVLTDSLIEEINNLAQNTEINGYFVKFKYCVFGQALKETILPPRQVLFKKQKGIYIDDGHTQLVEVQGTSMMLNNYIYHDDRKPLDRWLWAQNKYMIIEAKKLKETPLEKLSFADRIRKYKILAPFILFVYCLIIKQGIFDGWRGWYYAFQRMLAEIILAIRLIEAETNIE